MRFDDRNARSTGRLLAYSVVAGLLAIFATAVGPGARPEPDNRLMTATEPTPSYTAYQEPLTPTVPVLVAAGRVPPLEVLDSWTTTTTPESTTTTTEASGDGQGSGQSSSASGGQGGAQSTTSTSTTTTTTTAPAPDPSGFRSDYESDFVGRINSLRKSNGDASLSRSGSLDKRARDWAKKMAESGKLQHSDLGSLVPPWQAAGENLGTGSSVAGIFDALASSGSHRSTMLGNYSHVGVGVWVDSNGTLWTAHLFGLE